jgi:hypothetical protein
MVDMDIERGNDERVRIARIEGLFWLLQTVDG